MIFKTNILALGFLFLSITSCKPKVVIEDEKEGKIEFEIENIELTSSENESKKDKLILKNVEEFLATDKSDAVLNYLFLCDSYVSHKKGTFFVQVDSLRIWHVTKRINNSIG